MTVQELIDELNQVVNKQLPVALYADHGQTPQQCTTLNVEPVVDSADYFMEFIYSDDEEDNGDVVLVLS